MKTLISLLCMLFFLFGFSNCSHTISYDNDRGVMAPYQAEVLEFPVLINNYVCKDMGGQIGACTKIISERQDIVFEVTPLAYSYNLRIVCSSQIDFKYEADIIGDETHKVVLPKSKYQDVPEFICSGRITPSDRNFISSKFELRIRVQDGQYVQRGEGQIIESDGRTYLNMGKNALYTYVLRNGKWTTYKKKPLIEIQDTNISAFSESSVMRLNFYNL